MTPAPTSPMMQAPSPPRRRWGRWLGLALLGSLLVVGVIAARRREKPMAVRGAVAEQREVVSRVLAQGKVRARRQVEVTSEISGRVTEIAVSVGERVEVGQPLFALDDEQLKNATAQLRVALRAADAMVRRATLMRDEAERALRRDQTLVERQVASEEQAIASAARLRLAEADVAQAQAGQERARLELLRAEDALAKSRVVAPLAGVVVEVSLEVGQVVAPLSAFSSTGAGAMGGAIGFGASAGGGAGAGGSIVIADLSELVARLEVDELDITRVEVGQAVRLTALSSDALRFSGRIAQVAWMGRDLGGAVQFTVEAQVDPPAERAAGMAAEALVEEPALAPGKARAAVVAPAEARAVPLLGRLRPGMTVSAEIEVERLPDAVAVPVAAVLEGDGKPGGEPDRVWLIDESVAPPRAHRRPVVLGPTDQEIVAVVSGLKAGDRLVEGPFRALRELAEEGPLKVEKWVPLPDGTPKEERGKFPTGALFGGDDDPEGDDGAGGHP